MAIESIVNLTVGKIGELLIHEATFLYGVEDEVTNMQDELIMMNSFLIDMEALDDEVGDERVRNTAKQIRKIAYDAEDVIESFILEATPAQAKKDFLHKYLCFCKCLAKTHTVGTEIEAITKRISRTMDRLKRYRGKNGLTKAVGEGLNKHKVWRPAAYSHTKEDYVVGLVEDINNLVGALTTNIDPKIQVLSIVGMGGSGKTTLARELYNHESVKQSFESMAWVSISQQWVSQHVLHDILKKVSGETIKLDEVWSPIVVREKIQQYLRERKYLIVLDDVWTNEALEEILPALPLGIQGSKIIVTTRFREVVDYPGLKSSIHEPRELTADESWELFSRIALSPEREQTTSTMELDAMKDLAKEMLVKCKGLPLAVVAIAGLLAKKETLEEWELVKKATSSRVMEVGRGTHSYGAVKHMLALSYNDLPRDIKPCFLYLGLFPEDSEIPTGMLIRMWIAEGFVSSNNLLHEGQTLDDLARDYLYELIDRCVVRVASRNYDGKPKTIEIHDLMRDLCNKKARELDFLEILSARSSNPATSETQPRRTIIHSYDKMYFPFSKGNWHLRSLYLFARANVGVFKSTTGEDRPKLGFQPIIKSFKLLRLLNLVGIDSHDGTLPTEIGSLIHLRYFGLRVTNIYQLPCTIENLRNLLTLDYRGLEDYSKKPNIPDVLWKMESLRQIYLPFDRCVMEKLRFDTLQHLQTLWAGGGNWMMEELPNLSETVQKLHIEGIETAEQIDVAFQCPSIVFDRLHTLYFDWFTHSGPGGVALRNLEHIANCRHLRKLGLRGRIDDTLACFHFPAGIKKLTLLFTQLQSEETIAALGNLPNLNVLDLSRDSYVGTKWICSDGMFSQLRELRILDLPNLVEWSIATTAMRQLEKLTLWQCERLRRLPEGVEFIQTLKELEFNAMTPEFYTKLRGRNAQDAHIIHHIPIVRYLD
ncbi:hypothetical protein V2J09_006087 [Rumex salicifolius]